MNPDQYSQDIVKFYELYRALKLRPILVNNRLFFKHGPLTMPHFGNMHFENPLPKEAVQSVYRRSLSWGTVEFFSMGEAECNWYYLCKDQFIDLDKIPSKKRYQIKKGLDSSQVRRVSAQELLENGGVEVARNCANARNQKFDPQEFEFQMNTYSLFSDVVHLWGVLIDGKIVGFIINYVDKNVCYWNRADFCPNHLRHHISYALVYVMSNHYLNNGYVINAGFRRIYHETDFQEYLITKFGFRRQCIGLRFTPRPPINCLKYPVLLMSQLNKKNFGRVSGLATLFRDSI